MTPDEARACDYDLALLNDLKDRHLSTQLAGRWFRLSHLSPGLPQDVSRQMQATAQLMINSLADGPELTKGLDDLLRAKDWFVRAAVAAAEGRD
jgi:hypothetical protein